MALGYYVVVLRDGREYRAEAHPCEGGWVVTADSLPCGCELRSPIRNLRQNAVRDFRLFCQRMGWTFEAR